MELEDTVNNNYVIAASSCSGHEHFQIPVVDEIFNISVDDMFNCLFSESALFLEFVQQRNTYDLNLTPWPETLDENGIKTRIITYTLSINYSIGPKSSPSIETQRILAESQPGLNYLIDAECYNGGVPYADDFFTTIRYCFVKVSDTKCRLNISGQVTYKKHIWGLIKTFIDKTANTGLASSFGVMVNLLRRESERRSGKMESNNVNYTQRPDECRPLGHYQTPKGHLKEKLHRHPPRKRSSSYGEALGLTKRKGKAPVVNGKEHGYYVSVDLLARSIFVVVIFLVFINLALFYQVTTLEATVAKAVSKYHMH